MYDRKRIAAWLESRQAKILDIKNQQQAAVAMVLRDSTVGPEILFITRAANPEDPWSGQVAFPGGRREPEDRDLIETVTRETLEEVNLDLSQHQQIGMLDELSGRRATQPAGIIISCPVYWLNTHQPIELIPNYEVGAIDWVSLAHLSDPANHTELIFDFSDQPFPAIRFPDNEKALWGLTYRFVGQLLNGLNLC